ncbi:hypothetical protein TNCV_3837881 [Trichonephila clavipes]|nr:hypothetical protein TNCV_3837881 [Trichonephila clavipes]
MTWLICRWSSVPKVTGLTLAQVSFQDAKKSTAAMLYDYTAFDKSGISRQMRDRIRKWEIANPDDLDQDDGTKSFNYCIVIGPGQVSKTLN